MIEAPAPLAVLGGEPAFAAPLRANHSVPAWDAVARGLGGIFERRYFTNNGPLVRALDAALAEYLGVGHAVCVTNGTIALTILARALEISGEIIVPAMVFPGTLEALWWAGTTPVLCDVDRATAMISVPSVRSMITPRTRAILAIHLCGQACDPEGLQALADERGLALLFDTRHGIGCSHAGRRLGGFGAAEVFSLPASAMFSGTEGGCITTSNEALANALRTMRTFQPAETFAPVASRTNAKMSEAQAALALASLDDLPGNIALNQARLAAYEKVLCDLPGLRLVGHDRRNDRHGEHNCEHVVVEVDEGLAGIDRDTLRDALALENIVCPTPFSTGMPRLPSSGAAAAAPIGVYPVADILCRRLLRLPNAQPMSVAEAEKIAIVIRRICAQAPAVKAALQRGR